MAESEANVIPFEPTAAAEMMLPPHVTALGHWESTTYPKKVKVCFSDKSSHFTDYDGLVELYQAGRFWGNAGIPRSYLGGRKPGDTRETGNPNTGYYDEKDELHYLEAPCV